jgi:hypothetical protein
LQEIVEQAVSLRLGEGIGSWDDNPWPFHVSKRKCCLDAGLAGIADHCPQGAVDHVPNCLEAEFALDQKPCFQIFKMFDRKLSEFNILNKGENVSAKMVAVIACARHAHDGRQFTYDPSLEVISDCEGAGVR